MELETGKLYILKRRIAYLGGPKLVIVVDQKKKEFARMGKESYKERFYVLYAVDRGKTYEYSEWMLDRYYELLSLT